MHPADEIVRVYHAKLDELTNVDRQLGAIQPLLDTKKKLESEIAGLRDELAGKTPTPALPPGKQIGPGTGNDLKT